MAVSENAVCTSTAVINPQYLSINHQHKGLSTGAKAGISVTAVLVGLGILVAAILAYLKPHIFKHSKASNAHQLGTESGAAAVSTSVMYNGNGNAFHSAQQTPNEMAYSKGPISTANPSYGYGQERSLNSSSAAFTAIAPLTTLAASQAAADPSKKDHRHHKRRKHPEIAHHHHLFPGHACSTLSCPLLAPDHICKDFNAKPVGPCACTDRNCDMNSKEHECVDEENLCFCEEDECPDVQRAKKKEVVSRGAYVGKTSVKGAMDIFNN